MSDVRCGRAGAVKEEFLGRSRSDPLGCDNSAPRSPGRSSPAGNLRDPGTVYLAGLSPNPTRAMRAAPASALRTAVSLAELDPVTLAEPSAVCLAAPGTNS